MPLYITITVLLSAIQYVLNTEYYSTHTLLRGNIKLDYQRSISTTPGSYVSVCFQVINPVNSIVYAFAKASFTGFSLESYSKTNFYGKDPSNCTDIDLQGLWMGKKQYINMIVPPGGASNIYISVFNLDPSIRKSDIDFTLLVSDSLSTLICPACPPPSYLKAGECKCQRCPSHLSGYDCSRAINQLNLGQTLSGSITGQQLLYFQIPETSNNVKIIVQTLGGQLQVYFQIKQREDQIASYVNVAVGTGGTQGAFRLNDQSSLINFNANSGGSRMLITIGKYIGTVTNFKLFYQQNSNLNIIPIVLGILGGVLIIVLVIAFYCFYRRYKASEQNLQNVISSNAQIRKANSDRLTRNEIQRYFPQFQLAMIKNDQMANLQLKQDDKDCVICLCPIQNQQRVRMGYCRHIFHSACLLNWFKKQRNCPYCRQDYSKKNTIKHFTQVVKINHNKILEDNQLIKGIMKYNHLPSSNKISKDLQKPQRSEIQIQIDQQVDEGN